MRAIWIAIAITAAFALAPAAAQTWTTYASDELGYTIDFPAAPQKSQEKLDGSDLVQTMLLVDQGTRGFITSSIKGYPPITAEDAVEAGLDGALKSAGANVKLLSKTSLTVPGGAGVDATYVAADGATTRTRIYFVGSNLFQAMAMVEKQEAINSADIIRFFDSYRMLVK